MPREKINWNDLVQILADPSKKKNSIRQYWVKTDSDFIFDCLGSRVYFGYMLERVGDPVEDEIVIRKVINETYSELYIGGFFDRDEFSLVVSSLVEPGTNTNKLKFLFGGTTDPPSIGIINRLLYQSNTSLRLKDVPLLKMTGDTWEWRSKNN